MALTRQFLLDLGLEKDVMQKILDEHGETVLSAKQAAKEDAEETLAKKLKALEGEKAALEKAVKDAETGEEWKTKYNAEVTARKEAEKALKREFDDYKTGVETEKATAAKREAVRKQLTADGANAKLIGLLEKEVDLAALELDGEKIKDWDKIAKPVKESYADIFTPADVKGAPPATPPDSGTNPGKDPFIAGFDGK